MRLTIATLALLVSVGAAAAQDRFAILQPDAMNAEQKKLLETLVSGPRVARPDDKLREPRRMVASAAVHSWAILRDPPSAGTQDEVFRF